MFILLLIISCNAFVIWNSNGKIHDNPNEIPYNHLGLLGTPPITPTGIHNGSFDNRIKQTQNYISLESQKTYCKWRGLSQTEKYGCDEPKAMRDSLISNGVNPEDIFMDYEGLTTIQSLAKLKKYYSYPYTITILSQGYHNKRQ